MNLKNRTTIFFFCLFTLGTIFPLAAQQLPNRSVFESSGFLWNPAMTASNNEWEAGITHRQSWVGFEDAPQSTAIFGQYPFKKEAASIGGFLLLDEIKPIRNNVIGLTYAYQLEFGAKRKRRRSGNPRTNAQLSIGLLASMQQIFVRGGGFTTQHANDPLEPIGELNKLSPNIGAGLFYASRPGGKNGQNFFYAGLGSHQLIPKDILIKDTGISGNLRRNLHGNASIGYRSVGTLFTIEPSLWINFADKTIVNSQLNLKVEHIKAFWTGVYFNLNQTLGIQLGYKLPGSFGDNGQLHLGIMGDFNMGGFGAERGLGYGFYLAYKGNS